MQKRIEHKPTDEELKKRFGFIPSYDYIKTGKLHFGIDSYHAKRKNWRDTETKKVEDQIGEIVIWIMEAIHVKKIKREEREAEKQRWLEEQRIQEQIAERKEKELKQLELLDQYAQNWNKADRVRKFANAVESNMDRMDKQEKEKLINLLKWAREKADFLDPLIKKDDGVLGKAPSLFDLITDEDIK